MKRSQMIDLLESFIVVNKGRTDVDQVAKDLMTLVETHMLPRNVVNTIFGVFDLGWDNE